MFTEQERQSIVDEEHLKLLSIGYWVWGGIMAAYAIFMAAYFLFFGFFIAAIPEGGGDAPPAFFRWIFIVIAIVVLVVAGTLASLQIANGFWIRRRTHRIASMVLAGFTCMSVPFGTMLGVFSFIVFARPSVRALYGDSGVPPQGVVPAPDAWATAETP